jgi:hypothetical protein
MPRNLAGFDPIYEPASEHGAAMLAGSENAFEPSAPDLQREAHDEFTKMARDNSHLERLISRSMAVPLKIEGNC